MPRRKSSQKAEREHHYFRLVITYSDGETSANRVFKDRAKAEGFAARQKKSPTVKNAVLEPFVRDVFAASKVRKGPENGKSRM